MALLSRQFERDRDKVLERARNEGVCAILCWFSDIEKLDALLEMCKSNSGLCYLLAGIHPDNIERTNKKSHEGWVHKVEEIARQPVCVGILSGLNLSREIGTHFAQESLLIAACGIADRLLLPLVLHVAADGSSLERVLEILRGEGWTADTEEYLDAQGRRRVVLHDAVTACSADVSKIKLAVDAGFYFIFSAAGLTDPDAAVREGSTACVAAVPYSRILSATDSPWRTPQNLPDAYLRTLRNEPSNVGSVVAALVGAAAADMSAKEFEAVLRSNAMTVFGLESIADIANTAAATTVSDDVTDSSHVGHRGSVRKSSSTSSVVAEEEEGEEVAVGMAARRKDRGKNRKKGRELTAVVEDSEEEGEEDVEGEASVALTSLVTPAMEGEGELEGVVSEGAAAVDVGTGHEVEGSTEPFFGCLRCRCTPSASTHH